MARPNGRVRPEEGSVNGVGRFGTVDKAYQVHRTKFVSSSPTPVVDESQMLRHGYMTASFTRA